MENINGPVNFLRLEGAINNNKKIIYLFMDHHFDLNNQTKCESFDSKDISNYLYSKIKNTTTNLDFFMEIRNENLNKPRNLKKNNYINEIVDLFKSEFTMRNNIVSNAKSNSLVRLHYLDIRDYIEFISIEKLINVDVIETILLLKKNINVIHNLNNLDNYTKKISNYIIKIIDLKEYFTNVNYVNKNDKMEYYFNKIINNYDNLELKNKLNNYLKKNVSNYLNNITNNIQLIFFTIDSLKINLNNNMLDYLTNCFNILFNNILNFNSCITDIYTLRRILDKNYIKNIILYSGIGHSCNYIDFLVIILIFLLKNMILKLHIFILVMLSD